MSAFLVENEHIDGLLTWAIAHRASFFNGKERVTICFDNAEEIGRVLLDENLISVSYRYQDGISKLEKSVAADYRLRPFKRKLSALEILKAINCLDYQSCEHDGWQGSLARKILDGLQECAIRALPGYDNADGWTLSRELKATRAA